MGRMIDTRCKFVAQNRSENHSRQRGCRAVNGSR
jgi:hypothetical protein